MTKQTDLTAYIFDAKPHRLASPLRQWMEASPRFTTFVETYRDKIRKKVRITKGPESILDLRSELEVAYCLLKDRRLELAYEPFASAKLRGPDYAVTYRANLVFNVEASRIREEKNENGNIYLSRHVQRILHTVFEKLGQMKPGMANLLVIQHQPELVNIIDMNKLMQEVKQFAESNDPSFYMATGYTNPAAFFKDYLRLSGIILWATESQVWINRQAKPNLDEKVIRLVDTLLTSST